MSLPTNVGSGRIVGRYVVGVIDSPDDTDDEPELIPARGTITFTPSIGYVPNSTTEIPMTIMKAPITGVLDSEGYLCTPDNTISPEGGLTRGVKLFATDVGQVTGWTYSVKYSFTPVGTVSPHIPDHTLTVPDKSIQDLSKVAPTPYAPVLGIPQMEASVLRAESVAQSVRSDADAGLFDGEKGDVGPMGPPVALEIGTVTASAGNPADDDIMSTLILSGTKTQAAIKAQIPIEMIGEQGPKGDPGGWLPTQLNGAPINVEPLPAGLYYQTDNAATIANGYPAETFIGEIHSTRISHTRALYRAYPVNWQIAGNYFYEAGFTDGVLGPWKLFTSTRVDDTAGKAIYQWDPTAGKEQMIYGDTGKRRIEQLLINGWTGAYFAISRVGTTVSIYGTGLNSLNSTSPIAIVIPEGFRANGVSAGVMPLSGAFTSTAGSTPVPSRTVYSTGNLEISSTVAASIVISAIWTTSDPWPTTLPGTPA